MRHRLNLNKDKAVPNVLDFSGTYCGHNIPLGMRGSESTYSLREHKGRSFYIIHHPCGKCNEMAWEEFKKGSKK